MYLHNRLGQPKSGLRFPRTLSQGRETKRNIEVDHTSSVASEKHVVVGTIDAPTNLAGTATDTTMELTWDTPATSTYAVSSYNIYVDDVLDGTATTATYTAETLTASTEYVFTVEAVDAGGTVSEADTLTESTTA